ncbi:hypothetical protein ACWDV4_13625 [Micromonospora sp. NPDC003197]
MTGTVTTNLAERKRLARRLVGSGRGFAEVYGIRVTNNPASLFQVLYLSILLRRTSDFRRAVTTALALRDQGWDSPARLARSLPETRAQVLRAGGFQRNADELADVLGDLAVGLVERYRGDVRRMRVAAGYDRERERRLLGELAGVDEQVVDLFFRDVQAVWREAAPVVDRHALTAARRLDLARSAAELVEVAGSAESEKLAWLVGALARVDLEDSYDDFRPLTRA